MAVFSALISLLLLSLSVSSSSVSGNLTPAVDHCSIVIVNMVGCLPFVTIGSQVDKPQPSCCSGLKKVLDTDPKCLCEGLKNSGALGVKLNVTKASTLPVLCKLNAPSVSDCGLNTTTPATAPVPAAWPKSGPDTAPAPEPSQENHGSSLVTGAGFSFVISVGLFILFSLI